MKQYKSIAIFLATVIVGAVVAFPEPEQPEPIQSEPIQPDLNDAVDETIRQQISEYVAIIYDTVKEPKQDGNLEPVEEMIAESWPESLRQEVAKELSDEANVDGTLSDELTERIREHILDWLLQLLPEDLRVDIRKALEEYRTTGQAIGNNEEIVGRIQQYVASLELDVGRRKRGFWSGLLKAVAKYCVEYFGKILLEFLE